MAIGKAPARRPTNTSPPMARRSCSIASTTPAASRSNRAANEATMPLTVASRLPYLNVGCGRRVHADWANLDLVAAAPGVIEADLRRGIPFVDGAFKAVYHSHVLEHFAKDAAPGFV